MKRPKQWDSIMFLRYEQIGEIFDLLSLGVIVLSPERKIVSLNHAAESLTGKKATRSSAITVTRSFWIIYVAAIANTSRNLGRKSKPSCPKSI
jgi:PAS domain-containing protein